MKGDNAALPAPGLWGPEIQGQFLCTSPVVSEAQLSLPSGGLLSLLGAPALGWLWPGPPSHRAPAATSPALPQLRSQR